MVAMVVLAVLRRHVGQRITEAKKRADEANAAKGRFLANVSHEMRTPLNGVIAMTDLLRETQLAESQREIVETMSTSAQLALAQIEEILDAAKIEAGRVQVEARPFDLGKLLTGTVKVILPQARYKGLVVNTEIALGDAPWFRRRAPHAPGPAELAFERRQVHRAGRGHAACAAWPIRSTASRWSAWRYATRASAYRRRSRPQFSRRSRRRTIRSRAFTAAPGWARRSPASSSR